jgi:beta-alanine--pyruvate transaminase
MVPLGGAIVRREIYEAFMTGPEHLVEFFHGYTYSGHPLACAAGLAALKVYADEGLLARARALEPVLEDLIHSLRDEPNVIDVRNLGLAAAVELAPRTGEASKRAMEIFHYCFDHGAMVRYVGDIIAIGPALIATESELEQIVALIRAGIRRVA